MNAKFCRIGCFSLDPARSFGPAGLHPPLHHYRQSVLEDVQTAQPASCTMTVPIYTSRAPFGIRTDNKTNNGKDKRKKTPYSQSRNRLLPTTPRSLLSTELSTTDDALSLLESPEEQPKTNAMKSSSSKTQSLVKENARNGVSSTTTTKPRSRTPHKRRHPSNQTPLTLRALRNSAKNPVQTIVEPVVELQETTETISKPIEEEATQVTETAEISLRELRHSAKKERKIVPQEERVKAVEERNETVTKPEPVVQPVSVAKPQPVVRTIARRPQVAIPKSTVPRDSQPSTTVATQERKQSLTINPIASVAHHHKTWNMTPQTTRGGGVCMDLSDMFAATAAAASSSSSSRPHRPQRFPKSTPKPRPKPTSNSNPTQDVWAETQAATFVQFLNHTLSPDDDDDDNLQDSSFRALLMHQRLAKARHQARQIFVSQASARTVLFRLMSSDKIRLRATVDLCADLGLRQTLYQQMLVAYHPLYLSLGLDTLFGVSPTLGPTSPTTSLSRHLRQRFASHVWSDQALLNKYTGGKCKIPSGRSEMLYRQELNQLALYRLLVLVVLLDALGQEACLQVPLFCPQFEIKSSQQVLWSLARHLLHAQGDFCKWLAKHGVHVVYHQSAVDEIDYRIRNLATDLRDGARLGRLAEVWTGRAVLSTLRLPAVSRLQKLYNVRAVLEILDVTNIAAHMVVDGHQQRVLQLLWTLVAQHCLHQLLPVTKIQKEVCRLQGLRSSHVRVPASEALSDWLECWTSVVCERFSCPPKPVTGTVLCWLIHYYHPSLLSRDEVSNNLALVNRRFVELGGIPDIVKGVESSQVLVVSLVCSRLLESSAETRAARLIQQAWRACVERIRWRLQVAAAEFLWKVWKKHRNQYFTNQRIQYGPAVAVLEVFCRQLRPQLARLRMRRLARQEEVSQAIIPIQALVRGVMSRLRWTREMQQELEQACLIQLQSWVRRLLAKNMLETLRARHSAAITLQRTWGKHVSRTQTQHWAATVIQALWRRWSTQIAFQIDVLDIITVQASVRKRLEQQRFLKLRRAVLVLQKWRRVLQSSLSRRQRRAVVRIQCLARTRRSKQVLRALCVRRDAAVVRLQATVRAYLVACHFHRQAVAATCIQQAFRCHHQNHRYQQLKGASVFIQAWWRGHQAHLLYQWMRQGAVEAAVRIQAQFRCRRARRSFVSKQNASISMQKVARGVSCRMLIGKWLTSTTRIQSQLRAWIQSRKYRDSLTKITLIQSLARKVAAKELRSRRKGSVRVLQCLCRKRLATKTLSRLVIERDTRINAAVLIQSLVRRLQAIAAYHRACGDIVLAQAVWRSRQAKKELRKRRNAVVLLQNVAKEWLLFRSLTRLVDEIASKPAQQDPRSARLLQATYRGHLVRRELYHFDDCAARIQSVFRGFIARIDYVMDLMDVVRLQSTIRMALQRKVYVTQRNATIKVQAFVRQSIARMFVSRRLQVVHRERIMNQAAASIQKTWRCYCVHIDYMLLVLGIIGLQSHFRRQRATRKAAKRRERIVHIQSLARRWLANQRVHLLHASASKIQSTARMYIQLVKLDQAMLAATMIQATVRGYFARTTYELHHFAASEIQRVWRGHRDSTSFIIAYLSVLKIQEFARRVLANNAAMRRVRELQQLRMEAAAWTIQRNWMTFVERTTFARLSRAITRIQAMYRGYRKRQLPSKQMKRAKVHRERLIRATHLARANPHLRLGSRSRMALEQLLSSTSLSEIINAVNILELSTRWSQTCCEAFVAAKAPSILFSLIRTCNRSLPHVQLLHCTLMTLRNVVSHSTLVSSVATMSGIEVCCDLMQMFRDKNKVFVLAAEVLECCVFYHHESYAIYTLTPDVKNPLDRLARSRDSMKRLSGVLKLCQRKLSVTRSSHVAHNRKLSYTVDDGLLERGTQCLRNVVSILDERRRTAERTRAESPVQY